jgi:hypothetical protein
MRKFFLISFLVWYNLFNYFLPKISVIAFSIIGNVSLKFHETFIKSIHSLGLEFFIASKTLSNSSIQGTITHFSFNSEANCAT